MAGASPVLRATAGASHNINNGPTAPASPEVCWWRMPMTTVLGIGVLQVQTPHPTLELEGVILENKVTDRNDDFCHFSPVHY